MRIPSTREHAVFTCGGEESHGSAAADSTCFVALLTPAGVGTAVPPQHLCQRLEKQWGDALATPTS